jgi:glycosyltransferase involved in cell wall biosynthesis
MNIYPKVSLCIPIYGVEKYIERCTISLMEQTYSNIEYIFVNDCTQDNSIAILRSVINKYSFRKQNVHIINHTKNKGLAAARNTALNAASGSFIIHVDSDDYIDRFAVEKLIIKQKEDDADIVSLAIVTYNQMYTKKYFYPATIQTNEWTCLLLSRSIPVCIWGKLIKKSLYTRYNIRNIEGVNMSEDYQITPKLFFHALKVNTVNDSFYYYDNSNELSYCSNFSEQSSIQTWKTIAILEDYFKDKDPVYFQSLQIGKIKIYSNHLVNSVYYNQKSFYKNIKRKVCDIDPVFYKKISIPYQIAFKISNYNILRMYIFIIKQTRKFIKSFKIKIDRLKRKQ